jgi:HK97 gp10 family phage protein
MSCAYANLVGLSKNFAAASGQTFEAAAGQLVTSYGNQVTQIAQSLAPVKTGALKESITVHYPSRLTAVISPASNIGYARYQEFGTSTRGEFGGAAYEIKPKQPGGVLAFRVGGKLVITSRVKQHPGVPPHPYLRPAFERVVTPFGQSLAELGGSYVVYGPHAPAARPTLPTVNAA